MVTARRIVLLGLVGLAACSDDRVLSLDVTTGHETDAFGQDPAVTNVEVQAIGSDGAVILSTSASPGGGFSLGDVPIDDLVRFEVFGRDGTGDIRMRGRSVAVVLGGLQAEVLPIFAARTGQWSRPPGELSHGHDGGVAAVLGERLLLLTGGTGLGGYGPSDFAFYDMLSQSGVAGGTLAITPRSLVVSADGKAVLAIDDDRALWLDFDSGYAIDAELPLGLGSFAQVAGGRTIAAPSGSYVVGATRADEPSDRVLRVNPDRSLAVAELKVERSGAAAAYITEVGLVVAGGSATGAGAESIADGAVTAEDLPFPADPVVGAGAVLGTEAAKLILACGHDATTVAPIRSLDLRCDSDCTAVTLDGIDLAAALDGAELDRCEAFTTSAGAVLVLGDDGTLERAVTVDLVAQTATELLLREPRRGAAAVGAPNGTLALLGGVHPDGSAALTVETLFPE
jgi:hypothetical protein